MVVSGPCPGCTMVSSGRHHNFWRCRRPGAMIAARKVGATDRTGEQRIAGKKMPAEQQADAARRMTRDMDDLHLSSPQEACPLDQERVGRATVGGQTVQAWLRLRQERHIVFMDQQFGTGRIDQSRLAPIWSKCPWVLTTVPVPAFPCADASRIFWPSSPGSTTSASRLLEQRR